jgi:Starch/carbohydrate-binding module (family 53)/Glycosyl hydrolase family 57
MLSTLLLAGLPLVQTTPPIHTTYAWHLHQPIYWPDQRRDGLEDEYEVAAESLQQKYWGQAHPEDNLVEIFGKDDRVAAYQWRLRDSLQTLLGYPDAGAHIQYSGALTENVASLGAGNQLGYGPAWAAPLNQAKGWLTSGGTSRAAFLNFAHHHALLPLQSRRTQWLQIRLQQERMGQVWGLAPGSVKGFFPPETAFSERLIPVLQQLGIQWTFVSNEHLSRACPDYPVVFGSGGMLTDPPNRADQINPPGVNYWKKFIDRGCSPTNAAPFAYIPHRAQYVDPASGQVSSVIVVPTDQALSWDDGYSALSASAIDPFAGFNQGPRPLLVALAHDGDNAWGGGYSYYQQAVPGFVASAVAKGYSPSTVDRYLQKYPVPLNDVVHVEDGAWVNADSDFGSPQFTNWLWPLLNASGQVDPVNGWHYKAREYAIFTATENRMRTAENLSGGPAATRINHVLDPQAGTTPVERAWHYYLASMDSGNVYYGNPGDMEVKGTVGCNEALQQVAPLLANLSPANDATEPTVFVPQRWPYNPGGKNFGAPHGYQQVTQGPEFVVWTFAYDVTGIQSATLRWRRDLDGHNPLASHENELYAGGAGVEDWNNVAMAQRAFPANNVYGWSGLENYNFESPAAIAQHLAATISAQPNTLLDYYVEVLDGAGNLARSEIQHVWVGDGQPSGGSGGPVVIQPSPAQKGKPLTLRYKPAGGPLASANQVYIHLGLNGWQVGSIQHLPMTLAAGEWTYSFSVPSSATQVDCVFNNTSNGQGGVWDNNSGQDWHFVCVAPPPPALSLSVAPETLTHTLFDGGSVSLPLALSGQALGTGPLPQQWAGLVLAPGAGLRGLGSALEALLGGLFAAPAGLGGGQAQPVGLPGWIQLSKTQGALAPAPGGTAASAELRLDAAQLPFGLHQTQVAFGSELGGAPALLAVELRHWPAAPAVTGVEPALPKAGRPARIWYLGNGTNLAGKANLLVHLGFNQWQPATIVDLPMTETLDNVWFVDLNLPLGTFELDFVFTDGAGTWNNNNGQDWKIPVTP